jgi:TRAP-type mannitol/chloroaromatic compound transport system permease large subunit
MLIPPSVLMIVWGVLTEQAIGKIFIAGILPGFLLVGFYCAYIMWVALTQPERVGAGQDRTEANARIDSEMSGEALRGLIVSTLLVFVLIVATLGGIWLGLFTPTPAPSRYCSRCGRGSVPNSYSK